ncbi:histidine phosphatase family protein [Streptomyces sp. NPDC020707]|uniref:histidine phosphatase family protein n=1 Tax=Streptomyces sp. NPDC020707 TaxID=3365084 RepID=UPI0037B3C411
MTHRVTFVSPATSSSLRAARFDDGASIDAGAAARARAVGASLPPVTRAVVSPSVRCRETAAALGLDAVDTAEWAGLDVGRWRGRTLAEVGAAEPEAVARWLAEPASAPHGGESVADFRDRVARLLESSAMDGRTLAVVEPEVVRAAVAHVLAAPAAAFWRIDVPPLSATTISGRGGRWNLRVGQPLDAGAATDL